MRRTVLLCVQHKVKLWCSISSWFAKEASNNKNDQWHEDQRPANDRKANDDTKTNDQPMTTGRPTTSQWHNRKTNDTTGRPTTSQWHKDQQPANDTTGRPTTGQWHNTKTNDRPMTQHGPMGTLETGTVEHITDNNLDSLFFIFLCKICWLIRCHFYPPDGRNVWWPPGQWPGGGHSDCLLSETPPKGQWPGGGHSDCPQRSPPIRDTSLKAFFIQKTPGDLETHGLVFKTLVLAQLRQSMNQ